jgi:uncharacterized alpha-E superfamily protein
MLSRVAESIYWIARNIERAENIARFIDVTLNVILDQPDGAAEPWQPLVSTTGDHKLFKERYGDPSSDNVIKFLTFDPEYPNSIISCLHNARENARSVRETISSEMWEQLNVFYYLVMDAAIRGETLDAPQDFFHEVKQASHLFNGISGATLSRNQAWHFYQLGQMLERADKTSRILDVKYFILLPSAKLVGTPIDDLQWQAVLRSVSGFEMYRKRYHKITPGRVVEFLVLDRAFPRAIQHCIESADHSLHAISGRPAGSFSNAAEQQLGQLKSELAYANVDEIIHGGLHQYLDSFQTRLNKVGDAIRETFFALEPVG